MTEDNGSTAPVPWQLDRYPGQAGICEGRPDRGILPVRGHRIRLAAVLPGKTLPHPGNAREGGYLFDPCRSRSHLPRFPVRNPRSSRSFTPDNDIRLFNGLRLLLPDIFDTPPGRFRPRLPFLSLSYILQEYSGIEVPKSKRMQRSKWETRPLTEEHSSMPPGTPTSSSTSTKASKRTCPPGAPRPGVEVFASAGKHPVAGQDHQSRRIQKIRGVRRSFRTGERHCLNGLYQWRFQKARKRTWPVSHSLSRRGAHGAFPPPPGGPPLPGETEFCRPGRSGISEGNHRPPLRGNDARKKNDESVKVGTNTSSSGKVKSSRRQAPDSREAYRGYAAVRKGEGERSIWAFDEAVRSSTFPTETPAPPARRRKDLFLRETRRTPIPSGPRGGSPRG